MGKNYCKSLLGATAALRQANARALRRSTTIRYNVDNARKKAFVHADDPIKRALFKTLLGSTTMLGLGIVPPATAQTESDAGTISEVIVTAQRREERQIDVPISITALNQDMLSKAGITNTLELGKLAPGVILPLYGAYVLPSIRGISSSGTAIGDSTNVAVYIDGVYQANQSAQLADLPDVQSIQILKGPQGSLYGQNAAGGAIIIDTIAPSSTLGGKVNLGYGRFNDQTANGYVTGPLSDTVSAMASGSYRNRDGMVRDLLRGGHDDGLDTHQFRGKLRWEPSDGTSLTLGGFYNKRSDTGIYSGSPLNGVSLGNAILGLPCNFGGLACLNLPRPSGHREFAMNLEPDSRIRAYGFSLLGKFDTGEIGTLNTVTSYKKTNVINLSDVDGTPVNAVNFYLEVKEHDFIQEVNFLSNDFGGLTISTGAFFLEKVEGYTPQISNIYPSAASGLFNTAWPATPAPVFVSGTHGEQKKRSYAGYLELNYALTDQLSLTAAGRYSYEKVNTASSTTPFDYELGDPLPALLDDPRGPFSFKKFTPRAVLRYKPDNDTTFYASYSKGFKSGYVNTGNVNNCTPSPDCIDPPVNPEIVDAYEVGYKDRIGGVLDVSLSAFHSLYENIQIFIYNPPLSSRYQNAAAGRINGAEFSATLRATQDLNLTVGGSYLDTEYTNFPAATVYFPAPGGFGNATTLSDVTGNQLMRTPKWTANASITYNHAMSAGELGAYVASNYSSTVYFDPNNRVQQKGYALVDAELSFAPAAIPEARIVLWGKNLTDRDYLQSVLESQLSDAATFADPRTYGVRMEYEF